MTARVQIYGREGCHLCAEAIATVHGICAEEGVGYEVFDVDTDAALRERYRDEVPVVLVDGAVVGFWRIDPLTVRQALRA